MEALLPTGVNTEWTGLPLYAIFSSAYRHNRALMSTPIIIVWPHFDIDSHGCAVVAGTTLPLSQPLPLKPAGLSSPPAPRRP